MNAKVRRILRRVGAPFLRLLEYVKLRKMKPWKVAKCGWPYPPGYATYRPASFLCDPTILDTGLTKERAGELCAELNAEHDELVRDFFKPRNKGATHGQDSEDA